MKKTLLTLALAVSVMASAQIVQVESVQRIPTPADKDLKVAAISPDGSFLLLTSQTNKGLKKMDIRTGAVELITDAEGAGYNARITDDGQGLIYRETTIGHDKLRRSQLMHHSVLSNDSEVLIKQTRNLEGYTVKGNTVVAVNKRKMVTRRLNDDKGELAPVVSISQQQLVLTVNGKTTILSPNGQDKSYIWPSISPDQKHICYYVCGRGCYVCDIDGSNPQFIALHCRAAKWLDNETIIAMADIDNGEVLLSSAIVAYNLKGQKQVLTDSSIIAMYPYATADRKHIVCSSDQGDAYMINLK